MAPTLALGLVFVVLVIAGISLVWFPERLQRAYELFTTVSAIFWGLIFLLAAWVLLMTGSLGLMLTGAFILLVIVLKLYFDGPLGDVL